MDNSYQIIGYVKKPGVSEESQMEMEKLLRWTSSDENIEYYKKWPNKEPNKKICEEFKKIMESKYGHDNVGVFSPIDEDVAFDALWSLTKQKGKEFSMTYGGGWGAGPLLHVKEGEPDNCFVNIERDFGDKQNSPYKQFICHTHPSEAPPSVEDLKTFFEEESVEEAVIITQTKSIDVDGTKGGSLTGALKK